MFKIAKIMRKMQKSAQKIDMGEIADNVFDLDDKYKGIIHILAKHGGQYIWNITKLSKKEHTKWELDQKAVYRRLFGTPTMFSLIDSEYIMMQPFREKKRGNPSFIYTLTLKGILAALSTGIAIEDIKQFQNFISLVCSAIPNVRLNKIIEKYIKGQMRVFLIWHTIHGIQLQKQTGSNEYFAYFFKNFTDLPTNVKKEEKFRNMYRTHLKEYLVAHTTMHILDFFADPNREIGMQGESNHLKEELYKHLTSIVQFDFETPTLFQKSGENVIGLIQKWPFYLQHLQQEDTRNVIRITQDVTPFYLDSDVSDESRKSFETPYEDRVQKNLLKFMSNETADAATIYFSDKNFESLFRLYRQTRFPGRS